MDYKGVIFDFDGVLIDTEYIQWQGWVSLLKPYGIEMTKDDYFDYTGKDIGLIISILSEKYNIDLSVEEMRAGRAHTVKRLLREMDIPLMPYAFEAVDYFRKKGVPLALATASPRDESEIKFEKTGINKSFDVIVCGDEVKNGKPHPDIYLTAAEKIRINPKDCITFEDTHFGLTAAKAAGTTCYAVPNEYSIRQDFGAADKVFNDLKEAIEWIDSR